MQNFLTDNLTFVSNKPNRSQENEQSLISQRKAGITGCSKSRSGHGGSDKAWGTPTAGRSRGHRNGQRQRSGQQQQHHSRPRPQQHVQDIMSQTQQRQQKRQLLRQRQRQRQRNAERRMAKHMQAVNAVATWEGDVVAREEANHRTAAAALPYAPSLLQERPRTSPAKTYTAIPLAQSRSQSGFNFPDVEQQRRKHRRRPMSSSASLPASSFYPGQPNRLIQQQRLEPTSSSRSARSSMRRLHQQSAMRDQLGRNDASLSSTVGETQALDMYMDYLIQRMDTVDSTFAGTDVDVEHQNMTTALPVEEQKYSPRSISTGSIRSIDLMDPQLESNLLYGLEGDRKGNRRGTYRGEGLDRVDSFGIPAVTPSTISGDPTRNLHIDSQTDLEVEHFMAAYRRKAKRIPAVTKIQAWARCLRARYKFQIWSARRRERRRDLFHIWFIAYRFQRLSRLSRLRRIFNRWHEEAKECRWTRELLERMAQRGKSSAGAQSMMVNLFLSNRNDTNQRRDAVQAAMYRKMRRDVIKKIKTKAMLAWKTSIKQHGVDRMEAEMCLQRAVRLAFYNGPALWPIERVEVGIKMWRRFAKFEKWTRENRGIPVWDEPYPRWDAWLQRHQRERLTLFKADSLAPLVTQRRCWIKWRNKIKRKREDAANTLLAMHQSRAFLLRKTLYNWYDCARARGKEMRKLRNVIVAWALWAQREAELRQKAEDIVSERQLRISADCMDFWRQRQFESSLVRSHRTHTIMATAAIAPSHYQHCLLAARLMLVKVRKTNINQDAEKAQANFVLAWMGWKGCVRSTSLWKKYTFYFLRKRVHHITGVCLKAWKVYSSAMAAKKKGKKPRWVHRAYGTEDGFDMEPNINEEDASALFGIVSAMGNDSLPETDRDEEHIRWLIQEGGLGSGNNNGSHDNRISKIMFPRVPGNGGRSAKIDMRLDENGNTALHLACCDGDVDAARALLEKGAYVNCKNETGRTPLHCAASHFSHVYTPIVVSLLEAGGCTLCRDDDGHLPEDLAINSDVQSILRSHSDRLAEERYTATERGRYRRACSMLWSGQSCNDYGKSHLNGGLSTRMMWREIVALLVSMKRNQRKRSLQLSKGSLVTQITAADSDEDKSCESTALSLGSGWVSPRAEDRKGAWVARVRAAQDFLDSEEFDVLFPDMEEDVSYPERTSQLQSLVDLKIKVGMEWKRQQKKRDATLLKNAYIRQSMSNFQNHADAASHRRKSFAPTLVLGKPIAVPSPSSIINSNNRSGESKEKQHNPHILQVGVFCGRHFGKESVSKTKYITAGTVATMGMSLRLGSNNELIEDDVDETQVLMTILYSSKVVEGIVKEIGKEKNEVNQNSILRNFNREFEELSTRYKEMRERLQVSNGMINHIKGELKRIQAQKTRSLAAISDLNSNNLSMLNARTTDMIEADIQIANKKVTAAEATIRRLQFELTTTEEEKKRDGERNENSASLMGLEHRDIGSELLSAQADLMELQARRSTLAAELSQSHEGDILRKEQEDDLRKHEMQNLESLENEESEVQSEIEGLRVTISRTSVSIERIRSQIEEVEHARDDLQNILDAEEQAKLHAKKKKKRKRKKSSAKGGESNVAKEARRRSESVGSSSSAARSRSGSSSSSIQENRSRGESNASASNLNHTLEISDHAMEDSVTNCSISVGSLVTDGKMPEAGIEVDGAPVVRIEGVANGGGGEVMGKIVVVKDEERETGTPVPKSSIPFISPTSTTTEGKESSLAPPPCESNDDAIAMPEKTSENKGASEANEDPVQHSDLSEHAISVASDESAPGVSSDTLAKDQLPMDFKMASRPLVGLPANDPAAAAAPTASPTAATIPAVEAAADGGNKSNGGTLKVKNSGRRSSKGLNVSGSSRARLKRRKTLIAQQKQKQEAKMKRRGTRMLFASESGIEAGALLANLADEPDSEDESSSSENDPDHISKDEAKLLLSLGHRDEEVKKEEIQPRDRFFGVTTEEIEHANNMRSTFDKLATSIAEQHGFHGMNEEDMKTQIQLDYIKSKETLFVMERGMVKNDEIEKRELNRRRKTILENAEANKQFDSSRKSLGSSKDGVVGGMNMAPLHQRHAAISARLARQRAVKGTLGVDIDTSEVELQGVGSDSGGKKKKKKRSEDENRRSGNSEAIFKSDEKGKDWRDGWEDDIKVACKRAAIERELSANPDEQISMQDQDLTREGQKRKHAKFFFGNFGLPAPEIHSDIKITDATAKLAEEFAAEWEAGDDYGDGLSKKDKAFDQANESSASVPAAVNENHMEEPQLPKTALVRWKTETVVDTCPQTKFIAIGGRSISVEGVKRLEIGQNNAASRSSTRDKDKKEDPFQSMARSNRYVNPDDENLEVCPPDEEEYYSSSSDESDLSSDHLNEITVSDDARKDFMQEQYQQLNVDFEDSIIDRVLNDKDVSTGECHIAEIPSQNINYEVVNDIRFVPALTHSHQDRVRQREDSGVSHRLQNAAIISMTSDTEVPSPPLQSLHARPKTPGSTAETEHDRLSRYRKQRRLRKENERKMTLWVENGTEVPKQKLSAKEKQMQRTYYNREMQSKELHASHLSARVDADKEYWLQRKRLEEIKASQGMQNWGNPTTQKESLLLNSMAEEHLIGLDKVSELSRDLNGDMALSNTVSSVLIPANAERAMSMTDQLQTLSPREAVKHVNNHIAQVSQLTTSVPLENTMYYHRAGYKYSEAPMMCAAKQVNSRLNTEDKRRKIRAYDERVRAGNKAKYEIFMGKFVPSSETNTLTPIDPATKNSEDSTNAENEDSTDERYPDVLEPAESPATKAMQVLNNVSKKGDAGHARGIATNSDPSHGEELRHANALALDEEERTVFPLRIQSVQPFGKASNQKHELRKVNGGGGAAFMRRSEVRDHLWDVMARANEISERRERAEEIQCQKNVNEIIREEGAEQPSIDLRDRFLSSDVAPWEEDQHPQNVSPSRSVLDADKQLLLVSNAVQQGRAYTPPPYNPEPKPSNLYNNNPGSETFEMPMAENTGEMHGILTVTSLNTSQFSTAIPEQTSDIVFRQQEPVVQTQTDINRDEGEAIHSEIACSGKGLPISLASEIDSAAKSTLSNGKRLTSDAVPQNEKDVFLLETFEERKSVWKSFLSRPLSAPTRAAYAELYPSLYGSENASTKPPATADLVEFMKMRVAQQQNQLEQNREHMSQTNMEVKRPIVKMAEARVASPQLLPELHGVNKKMNKNTSDRSLSDLAIQDFMRRLCTGNSEENVNTRKQDDIGRVLDWRPSGLGKYKDGYEDEKHDRYDNDALYSIGWSLSENTLAASRALRGLAKMFLLCSSKNTYDLFLREVGDQNFTEIVKFLAHVDVFRKSFQSAELDEQHGNHPFYDDTDDHLASEGLIPPTSGGPTVAQAIYKYFLKKKARQASGESILLTWIPAETRDDIFRKLQIHCDLENGADVSAPNLPLAFAFDNALHSLHSRIELVLSKIVSIDTPASSVTDETARVHAKEIKDRPTEMNGDASAPLHANVVYSIQHIYPKRTENDVKKRDEEEEKPGSPLYHDGVSSSEDRQVRDSSNLQEILSIRSFPKPKRVNASQNRRKAHNVTSDLDRRQPLSFDDLSDSATWGGKNVSEYNGDAFTRDETLAGKYHQALSSQMVDKGQVQTAHMPVQDPYVTHNSVASEAQSEQERSEQELRTQERRAKLEEERRRKEEEQERQDELRRSKELMNVVQHSMQDNQSVLNECAVLRSEVTGTLLGDVDPSQPKGNFEPISTSRGVADDLRVPNIGIQVTVKKGVKKNEEEIDHALALVQRDGESDMDFRLRQSGYHNMWFEGVISVNTAHPVNALLEIHAPLKVLRGRDGDVDFMYASSDPQNAHAEDNRGHMSFTLQLPKNHIREPKPLYLWAYVHCSTGLTNSFFVAIDGEGFPSRETSWHIPIKSEWHWERYTRPLPLKLHSRQNSDVSTHEIIIGNRESGSKMSMLFIGTDGSTPPPQPDTSICKGLLLSQNANERRNASFLDVESVRRNAMSPFQHVTNLLNSAQTVSAVTAHQQQPGDENSSSLQAHVQASIDAGAVQGSAQPLLGEGTSGNDITSLPDGEAPGVTQAVGALTTDGAPTNYTDEMSLSKGGMPDPAVIQEDTDVPRTVIAGDDHNNGTDDASIRSVSPGSVDKVAEIIEHQKTSESEAGVSDQNHGEGKHVDLVLAAEETPDIKQREGAHVDHVDEASCPSQSGKPSENNLAPLWKTFRRDPERDAYMRRQIERMHKPVLSAFEKARLASEGLISLTSSKMANDIDLKYTAKRRTKLMQDIDRGNRLNELSNLREAYNRQIYKAKQL